MINVYQSIVSENSSFVCLHSQPILAGLPVLQIHLSSSVEQFRDYPDDLRQEIFLPAYYSFRPGAGESPYITSVCLIGDHRRFSQEIDRQTWEALAHESWGENYSHKVGTADENRAFGRLWQTLAGGVAGRRSVLPLTRHMVSEGGRFASCQNAEELNRTLLSDQRDMGFGFGRSKKQYFWDRILMSLAAATDPGSDGPHDSMPLVVAAGCEDWEATAAKEILAASLHTGGSQIAADDRWKIGWAYDFARAAGIDIPADESGAVAEGIALYLERVCRKLLGGLPAIMSSYYPGGHCGHTEDEARQGIETAQWIIGPSGKRYPKPIHPDWEFFDKTPDWEGSKYWWARLLP